MAVRVGSVCIEGVKELEDLQKHGIYHIGEDLDKVIKEKTPLDYEFLVIDGNQDNLFIKAVRCLFGSPKWPDDLKEVIKDELKEKFNEEDCLKTTFTWMSRIIERLPGRIIIIGDNESQNNFCDNEEKESEAIRIQKWIKRRILWLTPGDLDIKTYNFTLNNELLTLETSITGERFEYLLLLNWLRIFTSCFDFNLEVNLSDTGSEITKKEVENNKRNFINGLCKNFENAKDFTYNELDTILLFPFEYYNKGYYRNMGEIAHLYVKEHNLEKLYEDLLMEEELNDYESKSSIKKNSFYDFWSGFFDEKPKIGAEKSKSPFIFKDRSRPEDNTTYNFELAESSQSKKAISYHRHGDITLKKEINGSRVGSFGGKEYYYHEGLSGAAIHFQVISSHLDGTQDEEKLKILLMMSENGLIKILIADERIAKFIDSDEKKKEFENNGIYVLKGVDGLVENCQIPDYIDDNRKKLHSFHDLKEAVEKRDFDFFIIHQGIIDKIKKVEIVEDTVNDWKKKYFPFIIVTSGRGTPENVPINAKFLPFSNIETNLISHPISKFILSRVLFKVTSTLNKKE